MNKQTLTKLLSENLFSIPDYQRGYAWDKKQWDEFIQDVDALVDDQVRSHYTGTIVVYADRERPLQRYGATKRLSVVDVIDGQQRLTTCCLYLSVVIKTLVNKGENEFSPEIANYLYAENTTRLVLSNDCQEVFNSVLRKGSTSTPPQSTHQKRIANAHKHFKAHIDNQLELRGTLGVEYLMEIFQAITQKLSFTYYAIEEECEVGMTFELMNSRGKDLSVLELLKNYFMHWVSRNESNEEGRSDLTAHINTNWKSIYTNLGNCNGDEDQCLRIAWTLYCNHNPAAWEGYSGFKGDNYVPLRNFNFTKKDIVRQRIFNFADRLADVSHHYSFVINPFYASQISPEEAMWISKLHRTGNIANFLPLLVASRKLVREEALSPSGHIEILRALECYAYRVFLYEGRRSNAGKSRMFRMGAELLKRKKDAYEIISAIYALIAYYADETSFNEKNKEPSNWYATRRLLKYTLFEYELHLLKSEGQGKKPLLNWKDLSDSTLEHILPQNPDSNSHWKQVWTSVEHKECLHDIGNIVLTQNNSNYSNFEFFRKKGAAGISPSYANSDIRQERRIARHPNWTKAEFDKRRTEIILWINERWKTPDEYLLANIENLEDVED